MKTRRKQANLRLELKKLTGRVRRLERALLFGQETKHSTWSQVFDAAPATMIVTRIIEAHFNIPKGSLIGPGRIEPMAWPRHIAMHLVRELTLLPFESVAIAFGRCEATAHHSSRVVAERISVYPAERDRLATLRTLCAAALKSSLNPQPSTLNPQP
jgi:chromosomal replication initiation ATPase DnaA